MNLPLLLKVFFNTVKHNNRLLTWNVRREKKNEIENLVTLKNHTWAYWILFLKRNFACQKPKAHFFYVVEREIVSSTVA